MMEIKIRIREGVRSPFEYLLCADETQNNFRLVKHWLKTKRVGVTQLDTSKGIEIFGNDEQLTLLEPDFVRISPDVVRKVEDLKYTAISLWTMGEFDEVRLKIRELRLFLKINYILNKTSQN